ncbi:Sulfotransferase domain [Dillenia turbinata]|uniref:Sulfotransferase n=1 Tax=Dillenia turbinata TaxID=194707 RepID=A0AAN8UPZ9_9MAGN
MDPISKNCEQNEGEGQTLEKTHQNFEEFLSTLPRDCGWTPHLDRYLYQGCWYNLFFLKGVIAAQRHFKAQPTDIFLCSVPKSGTTWLKALAFAIVTRKKYSDLSSHPLLSTMPHECIPFLEADFTNRTTTEFPLISTHIPYHSLPKSIISSGCKIVYILRDPKDAFVSLWHFLRKLTPKGVTYISLQEALDLFCKGISFNGPHWDHVISYWKARIEAPQRVLFLVYEKMRNDPLPSVKKLADFIGYPFSLEEENGGCLQKIVDLCSFENLSNVDVNRKGKHRPGAPVAIDNNAYFRNGTIGDWRSHLTPEMAERLDHITKEKFGGAGLPLYVSDMGRNTLDEAGVSLK